MRQRRRKMLQERREVRAEAQEADQNLCRGKLN
jgi:hypothetical protein